MKFFERVPSGTLNDISKELQESPASFFENKWFYYLIRVDSVRRTSEFLAESADEDTRSQRIYAGASKSENDSILPMITKENYPRVPLMTVYNFGIGKFDDKDSLLRDNMNMDVDWFYYTPATDVGISDVVNEVSTLRKNGVTRLNTTGSPLDNNPGPVIHSAYIHGPDSITVSQSGRWTVGASLTNTTFDVDFMFRRHTSSGIGDWTAIMTNDAHVDAQADDTAFEFRATLKNIWTRETVTTSKIVKVLP